MKIIEVEQGSEAWLAWRRTVITATEASVLLGNNPWDTPYTCWQRKLGLIPEKKSNEAMERGQRLEPKARSQFIERYGIDMIPVVVESTEFDFLGASLDGISELGNLILEIKCGGTKLHEMAKRGEIPQYYQDQMQHQLLVTGAVKAFYYSFDGENGIMIEVLPDRDFKTKFMPKAREFWRCVALNEQPTLQECDYKDMSYNHSWEIAAIHYKKLCEEIKYLEEVKESYRKDLLKLCGDQNCSGQGLRCMKTTMRGRVDYDAIPELQGVNIENYRKSSTSLWKIMVA
jgi:putative phage-type endonuclease